MGANNHIHDSVQSLSHLLSKKNQKTKPKADTLALLLPNHKRDYHRKRESWILLH